MADDFISGTPSRNMDQQDTTGRVSQESEAKAVLEFHRKGLQAARGNLLTAEKYAMHLDGEGDAQWADIYQGTRVAIPMPMGTVRPSENLLRPIIDNAVAYHTTRPFRFAVEATADRESRQRAAIDAAIINHMARKGRWNRVFAEAMYFAQPAGHCPVHAFWRDDLTTDPYEPVYTGQPKGSGPSIRKGFLDSYVGDPWDTIYNPGSRRNSLHQYTYGRTLPLSIVQAAFAHVKGVAEMQGSDRLPSASRMQRIARSWIMAGLGQHGQMALTTGKVMDPLIALICRERAPGVDPDYPQGRITMIALPASATADSPGDAGHALLLHDGPLPASRFSHVRVYSHQRHDDIRGKPFVSDLDDQQVLLNQLLGLRLEFIRRNTRPPLVHGGMIVEDTAVYEDNAQLETEPGSDVTPQYLQIRIDGNTLDTAISECRQAMYTIGGYQAASRGESSPGDSGAKVVALARADDSIHGPINQRFREDVEDYAKLAHGLFRTYGDIPWLVEATGAEFTHMIEPWVDRSMVSQEDPAVELVSGFGATLETLANQLTQMVTTAGADGEPLITTRQYRAAWPDRSIYPDSEDVRETRERRAQAINARIRKLSRDLETQMGPGAMEPQNIAMAYMALTQEFPPKPDDDPIAHFDALSSVTQDENESPLARALAGYRQATYQLWAINLGLMPPPGVPLADINTLMVQAAAPAAVAGPGPDQTQSPQGAPAPGPSGPGPMQPEAEVGGTQSAEAIRPRAGEVAQLTAEAEGAQL